MKLHLSRGKVLSLTAVAIIGILGLALMPSSLMNVADAADRANMLNIRDGVVWLAMKLHPEDLRVCHLAAYTAVDRAKVETGRALLLTTKMLTMPSVPCDWRVGYFERRADTFIHYYGWSEARKDYVAMRDLMAALERENREVFDVPPIAEIDQRIAWLDRMIEVVGTNVSERLLLNDPFRRLSRVP